MLCICADNQKVAPEEYLLISGPAFSLNHNPTKAVWNQMKNFIQPHYMDLTDRRTHFQGQL